MTDALINAKTVTIGRTVKPFTTAEAASKFYRDHIGERGASLISHGCYIRDAHGDVIAHVSYNGRVWAGAERDWTPDTDAIWNPW
jgi:hypothetical protein